MSLLQYFSKAKKLPTATETEIGEKSTAEASRRVAEVLERDSPGQSGQSSSRKRKATVHSDEARAKIFKYAAINGTASARRHFKKELGDLPESTVRKYKNLYEKEVSGRSKCGDYGDVTAIPLKKRGRLLALGERLDTDVQKYIRALRLAGTPVSCSLVLAAAEGIVVSRDRTVLAENGGHVALSRGWALSLLKRMGYVKRKASSKTTKPSNELFEQRRQKFLLEISGIVTAQAIPDELVLNWDQTGLNLVPSGNWTLEKEGTSRVEIVALNDKRTITATFAATLSGAFLPIQLLYTGKTSRCHPHYTGFPAEFDIWHSPNHWANQETTLRFIRTIIIPYVEKTRAEKKLLPTHPALVIFDVFRGQTVHEVHELLEENHIFVVLVPSNCTDKLQPLDLSVNKPAKDYLKQKFHKWYAEKVKEQLNAGKSPDKVDVDMKLTVMKEVGAKWLVSMYDYLRSNSEICKHGFVKAGIPQAISNPEKLALIPPLDDEDPFADLD